MLFLALWCAVALATDVPTECNAQLHAFYVAQGMPGVQPVLPAFSFSSGFVMSEPYVEVTIDVQNVSRIYAQLLPNTTLANQTYSVDLSLDLPCCATAVTFECADNASIGTARTSNCTTISDFAPGGSAPVAGRFFIYANESAACNGRVVVRFFGPNLVIQPGANATFTYDLVGLRDHTQLSYTEAINLYRISPCNSTNGDPADVTNQFYFVCYEPRIGCNRTCSGTPTLEVQPVPQFACIGDVFGNGSQTLLITVNSYQATTGISGYFGITFTNSLSFAPALEIAYQATGESYILLPGTFRQFASPYDNFTQFILQFYNGNWATFMPTYTFSNDPVIEAVPCACGFSMVCYPNSETADTTSYAVHNLDLANKPPICNAGPNVEVGFGSPLIILNASLSYDPDGEPAPFNVYWVYYSTPYGQTAPFPIEDPQAIVTQVNVTGAETGSYVFVLYASDLQSQTPCLFNWTILAVQVFAVTVPDFIAEFTFYSGDEVAHPCSTFPPSPTIPLYGNYSFATAPSTELYYEWVQLSGPSLAYSCDMYGFTPTTGFFNTNTSIASFVPGTIATYCFLLTVWALNATNSTTQLCVDVVPNFQQPNATLTPLINYTLPPIRNLTPPNRAPLFFPNYTLPPFNTFPPIAPPPEVNTTVNPLFPVWPVPTPFELFVLGLGAFLWAAILLAFLFVVCQQRREHASRPWAKHTYGAGYAG